ncbi:sodium/potassium/calcium exchanger 5-like [Ptychodera flava]|uniref:sodium/potassium/calcium exchanger 5-like n=1 Tax=Ptychodera flava TaxID=63121 RepID=UPI00396A1B62
MASAACLSTNRKSYRKQTTRTNGRSPNYILLFFVYAFVFLFCWLVSSILRSLLPDPLQGGRGVREIEQEIHFTSRTLLQHNCTPRSIDEFPGDFMTPEQRSQGGVVVHIIIAIYMFAALAYICEMYFVPSLTVLCHLLHLQHDVAGATLMAVGSSAPEFAASVIGAFITKTDIGIGTVVGSLVFNLFIIIACCCFFAGRVVPLTWWPLVRDCTVYVIGIIGLIAVMHDNLASWYESMILFTGYIFYIILLYFNPRLSKMANEWSEQRRLKKLQKKKEKESEGSDKAPLLEKQTSDGGYGALSVADGDVGGNGSQENDEGGNGSQENDEEKNIDEVESNFMKDNGTITVDIKQKGYVPNEDPFYKYENCRHAMSPPMGPIRYSMYILGLPLILLMFLTIPDCRQKRWRWWFMVTFLMSTVWIAGVAYVLVWMVAIIGDTFGIPDSVMGITFLAAGTSIPDAMASSLVAADGLGDMAISNIIGSNIFEIFICLGCLWFIRSLISDLEPVYIYSSGLTFTSAVLLLTVFIAFVSIHLNGWKLDKKMGVISTISYAIIITFSILYELNVFMDVNPPPCPYAS